MNKLKAIDVIKNSPEINDFGYERGWPLKSKDYDEQRKQLFAVAADIDAAADWLKKNCAKIKGKNTKISSYGFKHACAKHIGYLTNGGFIIAMKVAGFEVFVDYRSINVWFNISQKSVKNTLLKP